MSGERVPTGCPYCGARLYRCDAEHTDNRNPGPRWHCSSAVAHNFTECDLTRIAANRRSHAEAVS